MSEILEDEKTAPSVAKGIKTTLSAMADQMWWEPGTKPNIRGSKVLQALKSIARKSAHTNTVQSLGEKPVAFKDVAIIFDFLKKGPKIANMKNEQLKQRCAVCLQLDTFRRVKDVVCTILTSLQFEWPKSPGVGRPLAVSGRMCCKENAFAAFRVLAYKQDARICTPTLLWNWVQRIGGLGGENVIPSIQIKGHKVLKKALFVHKRSNHTKWKQLSVVSLRKYITNVLRDSGFAASAAGFKPYGAHSLCGLAPSKLIALGFGKSEVIARRWKSEGNFEKSYRYVTSFSQRSVRGISKGHVSMEEALRKVYPSK